MALIRLHNEDWGFETNCFVCEPRNERGLRLPFFHDTDRNVVVAHLSLSNDYSGAPNFLHGGVTLAVLDEIQAWACIAIGHQWAVTTETTSRFLRPVKVDVVYSVEAAVVGFDDGTMATEARVLDGRGKLRVESSAKFTVFGEAYARQAIGDDAVLDPTFLRPE